MEDPKKALEVGTGAESEDGSCYVEYFYLSPGTMALSQLSPTASLYRYSTLPPDSIRLLRRVPQTEPDLLGFEFVACPLKDIKEGVHDYVAVSYCWGSMPTDRRLKIGSDSYLPISAKVEEILIQITLYSWIPLTQISPAGGQAQITAQQAQTALAKERGTMVWLDALCINQQDIPEKTIQIPLMADIYQHATAVEIWLDSGGAPEGALREIFQETLRSRVTSRPTGTRKKPDRWSLGPFDDIEITELLWTPWFTRSWVVQEFCFGKSHRFHFKGFLVTSRFLDRVYRFGSDLAFDGVVGEPLEVQIPHLIAKYATLGSLWNRVQAGSAYHEMLEIVLCRFYSMKSSDPRDKVFAMLNLSGRECLEKIKVDYNPPAPDIFRHTMMAIMTSMSDFSLLSFAGIATPRPLFTHRTDIPSWVPDLSAMPAHSAWWSKSRGFNASAAPEGAYVRSICLIHNKQGSPFFNNRALQLIGVCCDTVVDILPGTMRYSVQPLLKFVRDAMAVVESLEPYPNGDSSHDVLRRTLIANNPDCIAGTDIGGKGFASVYDAAVTAGQGRFRLDSPWEIEGRYLQTMIVEGSSGSRSIIRTRNGYIGLAANGVEVGDEVWLAKAARVPFIFRGPVATEYKGTRPIKLYRLVCEAYIHGIMNGELEEAIGSMEQNDPVFLV